MYRISNEFGQISIWFIPNGEGGVIIDGDNTMFTKQKEVELNGITFIVTKYGVFPKTSAGRAMKKYVEQIGKHIRSYEVQEKKIILSNSSLSFPLAASEKTVQQKLDKHFQFLKAFEKYNKSVHDVIKEAQNIFNKNLLKNLPEEFIPAKEYITWIKTSNSSNRIEFTTPRDNYYAFPSQFTVKIKEYPKKFPIDISIKTRNGKIRIPFLPQPIDFYTSRPSDIKIASAEIENDRIIPGATVKTDHGVFNYMSPYSYYGKTNKIIFSRDFKTFKYREYIPSKEYMSSYRMALLDIETKKTIYTMVHFKNGSFAVMVFDDGDKVYLHGVITLEGIFTLIAEKDALLKNRPISITDDGVTVLFTHVPFPQQIYFKKSSIEYVPASTPAMRIYLDNKQFLEYKKNALVSQEAIKKKMEKFGSTELVSEFGIID